MIDNMFIFIKQCETKKYKVSRYDIPLVLTDGTI